MQLHIMISYGSAIPCHSLASVPRGSAIEESAPLGAAPVAAISLTAACKLRHPRSLGHPRILGLTSYASLLLAHPAKDT